MTADEQQATRQNSIERGYQLEMPEWFKNLTYNEMMQLYHHFKKRGTPSYLRPGFKEIWEELCTGGEYVLGVNGYVEKIEGFRNGWMQHYLLTHNVAPIATKVIISNLPEWDYAKQMAVNFFLPECIKQILNGNIKP